MDDSGVRANQTSQNSRVVLLWQVRPVPLLLLAQAT